MTNHFTLSQLLEARAAFMSGRPVSEEVRNLADHLALAASFAAHAYESAPPGGADVDALSLAFVQALIDPTCKELDYLRRDPAAAVKAREEREGMAEAFHFSAGYEAGEAGRMDAVKRLQAATDRAELHRQRNRKLRTRKRALNSALREILASKDHAEAKHLANLALSGWEDEELIARDRQRSTLPPSPSGWPSPVPHYQPQAMGQNGAKTTSNAPAPAPVSAGVDLEALLANAQALLDIDASGVMVPHGIGGLARGIIMDLIAALRAQSAPVGGEVKG